ncbi:uncharacterized protein LOC124160343 [Ischnura elegans]|uniref:uncharacterized protein LOC124160343 n=1 Tax=Ischnura elegans TaxID=197161 RepID=UPI001ED886B4|nr:uncharacterized protein LOC124160343 [Ischnura elegans]
MAGANDRRSALSCGQLSPYATGDDYKGGGAKKSHHGYTFQFHLLMLFALRAYNLKYPDFKLGTEVADADKLDDIVFSYGKGGKEGDGKYFRLVQTKHTQREQKETLRARQLFEDPNKDFSLRMYFNAYRKLMQGGKLLGKCDAIEDLILCTNMNFKSGDRFEDFVIDEQTFVTESNGEDGKDRILRNKLKRFSESFGGRGTLVLHLKNCVVGIPSNFAVCVIRGIECSWDEETGDTESQLCELYENVLWDEVLDVKTLRFKESFCSCNHLSKPAQHFRDELFSKFMKCQNIEGEKDEKTFCKFLEETMLHESLQELSVRGVHLDCPKQLAKRLSRILDKHRDTGVIIVVSKESVLWKHFKSLLKFVLIERDDKIKFREEFLYGGSLPGNLSEFRESLEKSIGYFGLGLKDLENYTFEIESSVWVTALGDALDADVCEFLRILRFSVNQPSIEEMEELILEEIKTHFKEVDLRNAYLRFFKMMYSWAESKAGKYLTNVDIRQFFHAIQKEFLGRIRFNLLEPVHNFTGRKEQLEELHKWLHGCNESIHLGRKVVISQSTAISGLGGIGKSELAKKYAQIHYGVLYDNIIWIDTASSERLQKCFQMLAFDVLGIKKENPNGDKKALESIIWETYKFFEGKRTLFIFDNADSCVDLEPYFPKLPDYEFMYVIITSRSQNWGDIDVLGLNNFTLTEACQFIEVSLDNSSTFSNDDAVALANILNCFPLAIKQAVSYIKEMSKRMKNLGKDFGIKEYILLFEKKTKEMLDYTFPRDLNNSYSQTTYKTMHIAIDCAKNCEHGDTAIVLLNAMSYLSPNNIDVKILCRYLVDHDETDLAGGLQLLTRFSIVTMNEMSVACVHRLVQLVNRVCLKDTDQEEQTLMKVLDLVLLMDVEHAVIAWEYAVGYKDIMEKYSFMPLMIIERLSDNLMVNVALQFGEKAISTLKSNFGSDFREIIFIRRGMGRALYFNGKFEHSIPIFKDVLENFVRLSEDSTDVLWTKNYMGISLMQMGKYSEAKDLFMDVLKKGQSMVGEDSKLLFSAKTHIYHALGLMGNVQESWKYMEDCYQQSQKIVDKFKFFSGQVLPNEEKTVFIREATEGAFERHKKLLNHVIRVGKLNYDLDIDNFIQAIVNISTVHAMKGNFEESIKEAEKAYELLSVQLGKKHLKCVTLRNMIAINLCKIGNTEMALQLLRESKDIQSEVGRCKGFTYTRLKIADTLYSQLKYEEALKEYEGVDDDINDWDISEIPMQVKCKLLIAILLCIVGKPKFAVNKLGEVFAIVKYNSESIHSIDELICETEKVAKFILQKQNRKEALAAYKYVYQLRKEYKGEAHIDTLETKFIFSEIYVHHKRKGALEKGMGYLMELNTVLLKKLGDKDARVEALMMKIYRTLMYMKQIEIAESMMIETFKEGIEILGYESEFISNLWAILQSFSRLSFKVSNDKKVCENTNMYIAGED